MKQGCLKDQVRIAQGLVGYHGERGARAYNGSVMGV